MAMGYNGMRPYFTHFSQGCVTGQLPHVTQSGTGDLLMNQRFNIVPAKQTT